MRMLVGGKELRTKVKALLIAFFDEGDEAELAEALRLMADFYGVRVPKIRWRRRIDGGFTAARTHVDGSFELIRPRYWHHQKVCKPTPEDWGETVAHEFFHLLTYVDEERKADEFARRWMED